MKVGTALLLLALPMQGNADAIDGARTAYDSSVVQGLSVPVQSRLCVALGHALKTAEQPLAAYETLLRCSAKAAKASCALPSGDDSDEAAEQCGDISFEHGLPL